MRLRELDGLMAEAEAADLVGRIDDAEGDMRKIQKQISDVVALRDDELFEAAKQLQVPVELVREVHATGKLPVVKMCIRDSHQEEPRDAR